MLDDVIPCALVGRSVVRLRVPLAAVPTVAERLQLPSALRADAVGDTHRLWIAPDQWLLASDSSDARSIIERCSRGLTGILHLAVDMSAATRVITLRGPQARGLLSMGSGIDWGAAATGTGFCTRTRLARIAAVVHVVDDSGIDVYVDRSHGDYFERWLRRSVGDPLLREMRR